MDATADIVGYPCRKPRDIASLLLVARLQGRPKDFTWDELERLVKSLDHAEAVTGKTGGSRRRFVHATAPILALHKLHPGNTVKMYVIYDILRALTEEGLI